MDLTGKHILLTGGTGLIGRYATELLLKAGARVTSFTRQERQSDNPNLTYVTCDLRHLKENAPEVGDIDMIVYIAASIPQLHEKKETVFDAKENTLDPFLHFLKAYGDKAQKIIFTGTIDIYGFPNTDQFDESTPVDPPTPYALAKHACEEYLKFYAKVSNKQHVILRYSQVYGPNEPFVRVIPFIVDAAVNHKQFTMFGNPGNRRKFLYAEDAARAILTAADYDKSDVFQIAGSEEIAIADIVKTVEKITGQTMEVAHKNEDAPAVHLIPSTAKAEALLKFTPETSFEAGIRTVLQTATKS